MSKYYRVDMDDFERMPFGSDMDENWGAHEIVIEEQFKDEFIAEQVSRFTLYLLSILHEIETRGNKNPFDRIAKKYPRGRNLWNNEVVYCPECRSEIDEEDWNTCSDTDPCCPFCCNHDFEMEEDEE